MIRKIGNIILVGTSHVSQESAHEIEDAIELYKPELVTIELDVSRFKSLMSEKMQERMSFKENLYLLREVGVFGFLFAKIAGYVQNKIAKSLKIEPGVDMKKAFLIARENKIPVALVDVPIKKTLRKFSKLSFFEKFGMICRLFFKSFTKDFRRKLNFDVRKVPDEKLISELMGLLKKEAPPVYEILIEDRNKHMVKRLLLLKGNHKGNILAVVGAGHVEGMYELLADGSDSNKFSFSFVVEGNNEKGIGLGE